MLRPALAIVASLVLAGCAGGSDGATPNEPGSDVPLGSGLPAIGAAVDRTACLETQAVTPTDPSGFDGLPPGYVLAIDSYGKAILAFIHQDCGAEGGTIWVFVLFAEVPEDLRTAGMTYGGCVMAWSDDPATQDAFAAWGFGFHARELDRQATSLGAVEQVRVRGDPDFVFAVDAGGDAAALRFTSLRIIDIDDGTPGTAIDRLRPEVSGAGGPAHASLLPEADNPAAENQVGTGWVGASSVPVSLELVLR